MSLHASRWCFASNVGDLGFKSAFDDILAHIFHTINEKLLELGLILDFTHIFNALLLCSFFLFLDQTLQLRNSFIVSGFQIPDKVDNFSFDFIFAHNTSKHDFAELLKL